MTDVKKPLRQKASDPVWVVALKAHGVEQEMTVNAPDEAGAKAFVEQQNPGAEILSVRAQEAE